MTPDNDETSLEGMSNRQQRLVQAHLPLVHLTLQRRTDQLQSRRLGRERNELFQEGCLALIEAVRSHDSARHGAFAAYAMARIHFAMSRFALEQNGVIRVPFITQRRRRRTADRADAERRRPDREPRVLRFKDGRVRTSWRRARDQRAERTVERNDGARIGDLIRRHLDLAASQVVEEMKQSRRATGGNGEVLERCLQERWTVPEPEAKTSLREMAQQLGCSMSRISHCEKRFRRRLAAAIEADPVWTRLMDMARHSPAGMEHHVTREEETALSEEIVERS